MDPFIAQLADLCRNHPTTSKWVVVSSHALGHTLGDRLALEGTSWLNLRFKTPFDLALEVSAPYLVARGISPSAEDAGPALMMRLLRERPDETPSYFRHLALHPQMGSSLWSAVSELRLAGVTSDDLSDADIEDSAKREELAALLAAYERHLEEKKSADRADVFREAMQHAAELPVTEGDPVVTQPDVVCAPLEQELIAALPGELVAPCVTRVQGLEIPRRLQDARRSEQPSSSLLASLMMPGDAPDDGDADCAISLFRAGGRDAEVEEVFRRILHGQPDDEAPTETRFDQVDIASALPDYDVLIWEKAERYGWPVTVAPGLPVTVFRPARALLAWCDWVEQGFPASVLRRLLQSGDIQLDIEDGPKAGRAARLLIKAEATWGRATYGSRLTALAGSERAKLEDPDISDEERGWRERRAAEAERLRDWIQQHLDAVPDADAVDLLIVIGAARSFVDALASKRSDFDASAARAIIVALGELRTLGSVARPLRDSLNLIRASLDGVTVGADRPRPGHLHVSRLSRAGSSGRPRMFIVGLQEGRVFPQPVEDAVLLDSERQAIHPALVTSRDRVEEALHAVVSGISSKRDVTLSYSCRDLREYRETFPSWMMLQAYRLRERDAGLTYENLLKNLGEPVSVVPSDEGRALSESGWWLNRLRRAAMSGLDPLLESFIWLKRGRFAENERASNRFTSYDGYVPEAASALDPRTSGRPLSTTKLETLAKCPFRYFLEAGLRLYPLDEAERDPDVWLDNLTRGLLLHDLYARVMRRLRTRREAGESVVPTDEVPWILELAQAELDELRVELPPPSDAVFERDRDDILRDVELFLDYESKRTDDREPLGFEVAFGRFRGGAEGDDEEPLGSRDPVPIPLGSSELHLVGRIDRVDRTPDGIEVIDYKTGRYWWQSFSGTFSGGRLLQHALYGLAVKHLLESKNLDSRIVGGAYYFPSQKGGGQVRTIEHPSSDQVEKVLTDLCDVAGSGAFLHTSDAEDCKFCDLPSACGGVRPTGKSGDVEKAPATRANAARKLAATDEPANEPLKPFLKVRDHV